MTRSARVIGKVCGGQRGADLDLVVRRHVRPPSAARAVPRLTSVFVTVATGSPSASVTSVTMVISSLRPASRMSVDARRGVEHVAGADRAVQLEALLAVHDQRVVQAERGVGDRLLGRRKPSTVRKVGGAMTSRVAERLRAASGSR